MSWPLGQSSVCCFPASNSPSFALFHDSRGGRGGSDGKESLCDAGDTGSSSGLGRSPGERNDYPLQYSCLENPMDREPGRLHSWGSKESETTERITLSHFHNRGAGSCKHSPFASWENGQHLWQKVLRGPLYRERQEEGVFCFRCNLLLFLLVHNQH